jgi:hypothetical protein
MPDYLRGHHARVNPPPGRPPNPPKPPQPCECGCGELAPSGKRYIGEHGRAAAWTDERRKRASEIKQGELNPQFGKPAPNRRPPRPETLCHCGCGQITKVGRDYISGHNGRIRFVAERGGTTSNGRSKISARDHPFADGDGYVFEYRLVAEHALRFNDPSSPYLIKLGSRMYLSPDAVVHHVDGNPSNNEPTNLVVMSRADHTTLHHAQGDIHG